jgi:hypothetical protein
MTIQPVKGERDYSYTPEIGDVEVYGLSRWLRKFDKKRYKKAKGIFLLGYVAHNPWDAAEKMGLGLDPLKHEASYICDITRRRYCAALPDFIMTDEIERYLPFVMHHCREMAADMEWVRESVRPVEEDWRSYRDTTGICLLGTGRPYPLNPHNGHPDLARASVRLSNGDDLVVTHYEWFNK